MNQDNGRKRPRKRPNPDNKNEVGRCKRKVEGGQGLRRCDLRRDHTDKNIPCVGRPFGAERKNGKP